MQMNEIIENNFISQIAASLPRSALQLNTLHESDAELLRLPGCDMILALTTDSIVEEIESGLYSDPYLIGWMTVTVNASDLAAVGAKPVGILLNETFASDTDPKFIQSLQSGINDSCNQHGLSVLGGDTNFSGAMQIGACAVGFLTENKPLTRIGCRPGDILYSTGLLGLGSAFAFQKFAGRDRSDGAEIQFKPIARLQAGHLLRNIASCCMDTSDGAIATIDQLMRLNNFGALIEISIDDIIDSSVDEICRHTKLPPWMMLAGPHGEFELIFTVPPEKQDNLIKAFQNANCNLIKLGRICAEPGIRILSANKQISLPGARIRNLFGEVGGNVNKYIATLMEIDRELNS